MRNDQVMKEPFVMDGTMLIGSWLGLISIGVSAVFVPLIDVIKEFGVSDSIIRFIDPWAMGLIAGLIILGGLLRRWESRRMHSYNFKVVASRQGTAAVRLSGLAAAVYGAGALVALAGMAIRAWVPAGIVPEQIETPMLGWEEVSRGWILALGITMPALQICLLTWWISSRIRAARRARPRKKPKDEEISETKKEES